MEKYFYSPSVPEYVKQDFERFGYRFSTTSDYFSQNIILYERDIPLLIANFDRINQNKFVIIIDHHFVHHDNLKKIDKMLLDKNIWLIGTQYLAPVYKNLKTASIGSSELWCKHDIMKYLIDKWQQTRVIDDCKPFLLLSAKGTMVYHQERNDFINLLKKNIKGKILDIDSSSGEKLWDRKTEFDNWLEVKFGKRNMLGGFGSGLPRFDLYDKTSTEIVLETIYDTDTVHLSEKTWRPIACRVPAIFLLNASNIKYFKKLGYRLSYNDFYDSLLQIRSYDQLMECVLKHIDRIDMDLLQKDADYNYNHFWRYHNQWQDHVPQLKMVFEHAPIEEIFDRLKDI